MMPLFPGEVSLLCNALKGLHMYVCCSDTDVTFVQNLRLRTQCFQ